MLLSSGNVQGAVHYLWRCVYSLVVVRLIPSDGGRGIYLTGAGGVSLFGEE